MGWIEKLRLCSVFVLIYLLTQTECGPVGAGEVLMDDSDTSLEALKSLLSRKRRSPGDLADLQSNLEELKMKCRDAFKSVKDNMDVLKGQLDELCKQRGITASPTKDALNNLQKFIDMQKLVKINTDQDVTKIAELEKQRREAVKDLEEMKKDFSGNGEMRADLKIKKRSIAPYFSELRKYLEDKIKQTGKQDTISIQVLEIVTLQAEAMELLKSISLTYKIQAQINIIETKLEQKNGLLSDLKEVREDGREDKDKIDKYIADVEREIKELNTELSRLKQTTTQLNGLKTKLGMKNTEIMEKIAKLRENDELISRILALQSEYMEALINAQGQIEADEFQINELQKELHKEREQTALLKAKNDYLQEEVINREEECKDIIALYIQMEAELEAKVQELSDSNSKKIFQIILLSLEIDRITKQIKSSSSDTSDLKQTLDGKIKELKKQVEELQKSDANHEKTLNIISQLEEIWKLQTEDPENLDKISDLQKDLLNSITELDSKNPAKLMLKIMALQSDVTWIRKMLKTVANQADARITELVKNLNNKERMLKEKTEELAAATSGISQLQKEITSLQNETSMLKVQIDEARETAKQKIGELEELLEKNTEVLQKATKDLKVKDAEIAEQNLKIINLIEDTRIMKQQIEEKEALLNTRILELQDKLKKKEEENTKILNENNDLKQKLTESKQCTDQQQKYDELLAEYNNTVSRLNSTNLQQIFYIKNLLDEIAYLDKLLLEGTSEAEELRKKLEEKNKELEEAKQKLEAQGSVSAKTVEVLTLLNDIWKLQENPTKENLENIRKLDVKLNGLLSELQRSGEKGLDLVLQIISLKESMARLKTAQEKMKEDYDEKINKLESQIVAKDKEIQTLQASCEQTAQLKDRIKQLQNEVEEKKHQLQKLQQESEKVIASIQNELQKKNEKLAETEASLKKSNAENADLILNVSKLNEDLKKVQEEKNTLLENAKKENADLKEKLKEREEELNEKNKRLSALMKECDATNNELINQRNETNELKKQLQMKDQQLAKTESRLKTIEAENAALNQNVNKLNEDFERLKKEKDDLQKDAQKQISDLNKKLEQQKQELAEKDQKLKQKDETISALQKERDDIRKELEKEKKKITDLNDKLEQQKKELAEKDQKLKQKDETISALQKERDDLKSEVEKEKKKNTDLNEKLEQQKKELAEKDQKLKQKDQTISALEKERDDARKELEKEQKKNTDLGQQLEKAKEKVKELEETVDTLTSKIESDWPKLDPGTAHRRLVLSQNEREARTSVLPQSLPNNPERYDTAIAALGRDGYNSGRRYWEVGVAGLNCYTVGMVRASAQRKGILSYGPQNGYWVIFRKRDGKHFVIDTKSTILNMANAPTVIGVLVDFKRKEISFYNAETKDLIYKFSGNEFQEKLHPYVEACSDSNNAFIIKQVQSTDWLKP